MRSIRSKLIFWICILFVFIGVLIYLPLSIILPQKITSQVLKRDAEIAKYLSSETKELLLLNDRIALSILLHDNVEKLEDAQYLFVQGADGEIASHTFTKGFPRALLSLNFDKSQPYNIKDFLDETRHIYDIAVPISDGELGVFHMGVSLESSKKDIAAITKINYYVAIVILIGLVIGILAFNEMALRLKQKINEIKRLNTVEERNKIALDLHDGCAQDLANIIKRLELSEKLFKVDPKEAFEEMDNLKENTKELLNRTRRVICDLKSPQDKEFDLLTNLYRFIEAYESQNDIKVKLNEWSGDFPTTHPEERSDEGSHHIPQLLDNVSSDKSKSIFYIIVEALTNVRKHSKAQEVELNLQYDEDKNLKICIRDNGTGFDIENTVLFASSQERWGLIGMRERACSLGGTFDIDSQQNQGTNICVSIPLEREIG